MIAPVLVLIMIGLIDFSLVLTRQMSLANAVRAGLQYATIRRPIQGDVTAIRQAVLDAAPIPKIGTHDPTVLLVCECPDGTGVADCDPAACGGTDILSFIDITLEEDFPLLLPYPGFSNPISLSEQATVRLN